MLAIFLMGAMATIFMLWLLSLGTRGDGSRSSLFNNYGKGGSQTTVYQPTPPTAPSISDTMADYTESLPALYAAQMEYAPQLAQQQVDLMSQYGGQYGQAMKDSQAAMNPETTALQEKLAGQASEGMDAGLSDFEKEQYRDTMSANLGTNAGSGIGADYMSTGMMQAQQGRQDQYRNLGLSLAGKQQMAQPSVPGQANYMQGYQPGQALGFASQNYGSFANAGRPMAMTNSRDTGLLGMWGGY